MNTYKHVYNHECIYKRVYNLSKKSWVNGPKCFRGPHIEDDIHYLLEWLRLGMKY
jgi:hypothetical protein